MQCAGVVIGKFLNWDKKMRMTSQKQDRSCAKGERIDLGLVFLSRCDETGRDGAGEQAGDDEQGDIGRHVNPLHDQHLSADEHQDKSQTKLEQMKAVCHICQ